jgi:hypothetical protein
MLRGVARGCVTSGRNSLANELPRIAKASIFITSERTALANTGLAYPRIQRLKERWFDENRLEKPRR